MRRNREAGQAIVAVALGLVVLVGILGLGIDFGFLRYQKRQMQTAADAAAVAGSGVVDLGSTAVTTAARTMASQNGFTNGTGGVTVAVNNPPSSVATDPHFGNSSYVEVVISQNQPTFFARAFGVTSVPLGARAEGAEGGGTNCMYALDQTGSGAITLAFGAIDSGCGIVDESSSSNAFSCFIGFITAPYTGIVGNNGFLCFFTPGATTGIPDPSPHDPLQHLQSSLAAGAPAPASCGTVSGTRGSGTYTGSAGPLTVNGTVTLNPGTYCGGLTVAAGANLTLNPGIYTLTSTSSSNGGLTINAGTTVTGNGVGFYNYGPHGGVNFLCSSCTLGSDVLTAPNATNCGSCASAWQGILFYQDPGDSATSTVVGSASFNTKPTGTSYFPNATVTYAFDISVTYNILVAKDIVIGLSWDQNNTKTYTNYNELEGGSSPIKAGDGVLVE